MKSYFVSRLFFLDTINELIDFVQMLFLPTNSVHLLPLRESLCNKKNLNPTQSHLQFNKQKYFSRYFLHHLNKILDICTAIFKQFILTGI